MVVQTYHRRDEASLRIGMGSDCKTVILGALTSRLWMKCVVVVEDCDGWLAA